MMPDAIVKYFDVFKDVGEIIQAQIVLAINEIPICRCVQIMLEPGGENGLNLLILIDTLHYALREL